EPTIEDMRTGVIDDLVAEHIPHDAYPEAWDIAGLKQEVKNNLNLELPVDEWAKEEGIADEEVAMRLHKAAEEAYARRVERNTPEAMRYVEKQVILQPPDHLWREHLVSVDPPRPVASSRQLPGWQSPSAIRIIPRLGAGSAETNRAPAVQARSSSTVMAKSLE